MSTSLDMPTIAAIASSLAAVASWVTAWMSWRASKRARKVEEWRYRNSALMECLYSGQEVFANAYGAFYDSPEVISALREYHVGEGKVSESELELLRGKFIATMFDVLYEDGE